MTDLEQKNLKTQIELLKEIAEADKMIIHSIRTEASSILLPIKHKQFLQKGQKTIELTEREFREIIMFLASLSANAPKEVFGEINKNSVRNYIEEKETKTRILNMLSK